MISRTQGVSRGCWRSSLAHECCFCPQRRSPTTHPRPKPPPTTHYPHHHTNPPPTTHTDRLALHRQVYTRCMEAIAKCTGRTRVSQAKMQDRSCCASFTWDSRMVKSGLMCSLRGQPVVFEGPGSRCSIQPSTRVFFARTLSVLCTYPLLSGMLVCSLHVPSLKCEAVCQEAWDKAFGERIAQDYKEFKGFRKMSNKMLESHRLPFILCSSIACQLLQ